MSRKKRLLIVSAVAAIVVGVVGVVVVQAADPAPSTVNKNPIMARVAAILGIEQTKLEDAFAQAQKEQRVAALDAYLKKLVADGRITQAQADQYKQWWSSRPNVPGIGPGMPGVRGPAPQNRMMPGNQWVVPKMPGGMPLPGRPGAVPPGIPQPPPVTPKSS